ncbi:MAG: RNase adapter RapZ [Bryobacteraceae bacterium]|nr:RNase adapter RapZ [Bryobacteraceae bacterium]
MPKKAATVGAPDSPALKPGSELVIITGLSGSGKGTVLKVFEDLGFFSVDNLPIELIPKFAQLAQESRTISRAALVVDVREGDALLALPALYRKLRRKLNARLLFLEAADESLLRRFSETRRPHPLGADMSVTESLQMEREQLQPIRALADQVIDTSRFTVHELRDVIKATFASEHGSQLLINVMSFGFRNGVPADADLVFDVRFLPNPNYIAEFKPLTGKNSKVARYIAGYPQTQEFISRTSGMLDFLIPHYMREGKSYLTIAFGCTGGQHRSVMMAAEICRHLTKTGFKVKESHRDMPRT